MTWSMWLRYIKGFTKFKIEKKILKNRFFFSFFAVCVCVVVSNKKKKSLYVGNLVGRAS